MVPSLRRDADASGGDPDQPAPPGWLIELPACPSTNTWALAHLEALAHGACIWTQRQTAGRGRDGRSWRSPRGVLTASWVLDCARAHDLVRLGLAASLAVAHAVEDAASPLRVQVKWPNDCVVGGRKLAGILVEGSARRAVVGIGLNIDPRWEQDADAAALLAGAYPPVALSDLVAVPPTTGEILPALRRYLLEASGLIAAGGWTRLLPELRARDCLRGTSLRVETADGAVEGRGDGVDDDGRLLLRGPGGHRAIASATRVLPLRS